MITSTMLPLYGDRYTPFETEITLSGVDLTDAVFAMQVRERENGGNLEADLGTVTAEDTEGVRLVSVQQAGGVYFSKIGIFIAEATMEAMSTGPEIDSDAVLYYDLHITPDGETKRVYLHGTFTNRAGATS